MAFSDLVRCFQALGDVASLQAIHISYPDVAQEEAGWFFSKAAAEDIVKLAQRRLLTVDDSALLHTARLDRTLIGMMSMAAGEKAAAEDGGPEFVAYLRGAEIALKKYADDVEVDQDEAAEDIPAAAPAPAPAPIPAAPKPAFDPMAEARLVGQWQKSREPAHLSELLTRYTPLLKHHAQRYYGADLPPAAIDAEAKQIAIHAFEGYDPSRGVKLSTYVTSHLPKLRRYVITHQNPVRMPEDVSLRVGSYKEAVDDLTHDLGRAPSAQEVADHRSWSLPDVKRLNMLSRGASISELSESVPSAADGARRADIFIDYLYHELDGDEKRVMEHIYGLHGTQKAETSGEISKLSGISPAAVNRIRAGIAEKIRSHLDQV